MKRNIFKIGFMIFIPVMVLLFGCTGIIRTSGVTKFDNWRDVKKIAFLPTVYENKSIAERMNKIHYKLTQVARQQGYIIISVDEVENYLGKEFKELEKDPTNEALIKKIASKFDIEAVIYCKINDWQQDILDRNRGGYYFNKLSLSYSMIDAKTLRPMSKISGTNEDTAMLDGDMVIDGLAEQLTNKFLNEL